MSLKILLPIFLCLFALPISYAQKANNQYYSTDTIRLSYYGGDDESISYEILIFKNGKSVFAARYGDPLFVADCREPIWIKRLTKKNIRQVDKYISQLKAQQLCVGASSVYEHISIVVKNDTLAHYKGYCFFGFPIEEQLFKQEYKALADRQKQYEDSLSNVISGIWYPGVVRSDSTWKYLFLDRNYQANNSYGTDCTWEFSSSGGFKSHCAVFDLVYSEHYKWSIYRKEIGLDISAAYSKYPNDPDWKKNDGKEYVIVSISPDQIILKNRWGY